jgi:Cytochrome c7 and related cytochrome c
MADPRRTQKQISERYQHNLTLYRRLRASRWVVLVISAILCAGTVALVLFYNRQGPQAFFTAGPISTAHTTFGNDCRKCHEEVSTRSNAERPQQLLQVIRDRFSHGIPLEPIDRRCETCHAQHSFHQANVIQNRSCSVCHQEHKGATSLRTVASIECAACHNDAQVMEASARKGKQLSPAAFQIQRVRPMQVALALPRPPDGYTRTFASFWKDHPEFQLQRDHAADPDTLRFNHQRHFAPDIPSINGRKLECISCHVMDDEGRYMKRISFVANCQACHSLQFDPNNPDLTLPHGDPNAVHAFLQTLPTQYAQLATKRGLRDPAAIRSFVNQQLVRLRDSRRSTEDLEHDTFFTTSPYRPDPQATSERRGAFYGCAVCHEVSPRGGGVLTVTKPFLTDRWMTHAHFNHAKHAVVKCDDCHHATASGQTAEVLMPAKASCVTCHSPQGKAPAQCMTCHIYHAPSQRIVAQSSNANPSIEKTLLRTASRPP